MNKTAIRRRGYRVVEKWPVIEVLHPDAFLITWTGGDIYIQSNTAARNLVTKVILDGVTYVGSDISTVLTSSGNMTITPIVKSGNHECYIYVNDNSGWNSKMAFYRNDWPYFSIRYPRRSTACYHTGYHWNDLVFTGPYIKYIGDWPGTSVHGKVYIPYDLEVNENDKYYKNKYIRVKYKFIEDE